MKKTQNTPLGNRLYEICGVMNCKLPDLSKMIDVPYTSLYKWATGATLPSSRLYEGLYGLGVNINWLVSGEGQMMRNQESASAENIKSDIQIVNWVQDYWDKAEPDERIWLDVEMKRCFKEYRVWRQL